MSANKGRGSKRFRREARRQRMLAIMREGWRALQELNPHLRGRPPNVKIRKLGGSSKEWRDEAVAL